MSADSDLGSVLLDPFATQRCDVRLQHSFDDALRSVVRPAPSPTQQRRIDAGALHRRSVTESIADAAGSEAVRIDGRDRAKAQEETLAAMTERRPLIIGGWFPPDFAEHRSGRPDLLVMTSDGYLPVQIKLHLLTTPGNGSLHASNLAAPFPAHALPVKGRRLRKGAVWFNDALELAHLARMLDARGFRGADDGLLGGVIDGTSTVWWIAHDARRPRDEKTVAATYDERFAERLAVVAHTVARNADPSMARARSPWWHKECERCPYEQVCHHELSARDDVSLVRWIAEPTLEELRARDVTTRAELGALDLEICDIAERCAHTSMGFPDIVELARHHDPHVALGEVIGARPGLLRRFEHAGLTTVADLLGRDATTLRVAGTIADLGRLVRRARAGIAGGVVRQVPVEEMTAMRADVEVDIDMESYEHATYLWGALVTSRQPTTGVEDGYRSFGTFDLLTPQAEAEIFNDLWTWLMDLRSQVRAQGRTFRAYCFWRPAEEGQMRRAVQSGAEGLPTQRQLDRFFASSEWIDLHQLAKDQLITEGPLGLKVLATRAGFSWGDDDPSGEASIGWYEEAMSSSSDLARERLLRYNEDDVRATRALRDWLDGPARSLKHVDEVLSPKVGP